MMTINTGDRNLDQYERPEERRLPLLIIAKAITPEAGGIETYSEQIAHAYAGLGFDVTVVSCFTGERGESTRGSVRIVNVGMGSQWLVAIRLLLAALRYRAGRGRPTFIHATTWRVALPALLAFPRIPLLITVHGREVTEMSGLTGIFMKLAFRGATRAVVISDTTLAAAARCIPKLPDISIVSWNGTAGCSDNAFSEATRRRAENTVCRILTVCRLVPRKNVANVMRALAILNDGGCTGWQYSVVGDGPEFERLMSVRQQAGVEGQVQMHGRVSDRKLDELFGCSDIFAHPQITDKTGRDIEGFGLVIVDAMSWGMPVIVGRDGAPDEYVRHGETGFVVDGENPGEIAAALRQLIESRDRRRSVGTAARNWVSENLSWRKHVARALEDPGFSEIVDLRRERNE